MYSHGGGGGETRSRCDPTPSYLSKTQGGGGGQECVRMGGGGGWHDAMV